MVWSPCTASSVEAPAAAGASTEEAVQGLQTIGSYLQQLGSEYPEVKESEGYASVAEALLSLSALAPESGEKNTRIQSEKEGLLEFSRLLSNLKAGLQHLKEETASMPAALILDIREASNRDMTRVIAFVLLGIMVVLILLLRSLVAPIYLILTILLSYAATMGIVKLVFSTILGIPGITWWVPIFMFVMLVALGMDYNIFLMGRMKEEVG